MAREVSGHTAAMLAAAQRRGVRRGLLALAGACVLLVTVWALVLPGVTMANATFCGQEEHEHSGACYQQVLTCGFEGGSEGGSASPSGKFNSDVSDAAAGEQSASAGSGAAGEGLGDGSTAPASGAVNSPDGGSSAQGSSSDSSAGSAEGGAFAASEGAASAAAGASAASAANAASTASAAAGANAAMSDAPADAAVVSLVSDAVAAELPASSSAASSSGHVHSEACYESVLVCEISEHEHSLACYSDSSADLETEAAWEATLPADDDMTGNWAADVLAVADSQLGYKESAANYAVVENAAGTEVAKGYTRYGAWWGDAYGDWCAMFASFCLSYAGVPEEVVPQDANCQNWIEALSAEGVWLWRPVEAVENAEGAAQRTGVAVVPAEAVAAWEAEAAELAELAELAEETAGGEAAGDDASGESASANAGVDAAAADSGEAEGEGASSASLESDASLEAALLGGSSARYTALGGLIYDPQPGDLVFFDWDNDGEADHVGFVYELLDAEGNVVAGTGDASGFEAASSSAGEENAASAEGSSDGDGLDSAGGSADGSAANGAVAGEVVANDASAGSVGGSSTVAVKLKTIEGNVSDGSADTVCYKEYDLTDPSILGYASLPENPETQVATLALGETSLAQEKIARGNAELPTVEGAKTRSFVEINLYDYDASINEKYGISKGYPGFQQDGGSRDVGSSFSSWKSFNFGNNITEDLTAGISGVTDAGGAKINGFDSEVAGRANAPVSGAMSKTLQNGYPALEDDTSLSYLFDGGKYSAKQNKESIDGLFKYDETSGAYSFNSRENHAQFNADDDTFTLYKQVITSNFMMYPFGNFLPFNDIKTQCEQAGSIDKAYLTSIASSAQAKYAKGMGEEYKTLSEQLTKFISLMDKAYPEGWTAADCANEYFKAAKLDKTFTADDLSNVYSIDYDEPTDFFFGMEMKMSFTQPKGGMTGKDNGDNTFDIDEDTNKRPGDPDGFSDYPMEFYFTGDDDVWVYIDDVLFLDLSGIHRHVGGKIDFVDGVVEYYSLDVSTGDVSDTPYKTVKFSDLVASDQLNDQGTFKDYSTHSFNFYYMERGAGSGVCRMNFNFPLLKQNTISVSKEVDSGTTAVLGDPDYKFQILKAGTQGESPEDSFVEPNTPYTIYDADGKRIGSGTTDSNGVFVLKAGQCAEFSVEEDAGKYYVRELLPDGVGDQYGEIVVSGEVVTKRDEVTVGNVKFSGVNSPIKNISDGATKFHFSNKVTEDSAKNLGSLSIKKELVFADGNVSSDFSKEFHFEAALDDKPLPKGTPYEITTGDGSETREVQISDSGESIVSVPAGGTATISGILLGSKFTVKETSDSAKGYTVTYPNDKIETDGSSASGIVDASSGVSVLVKNSENGVSVGIPVEKKISNPDGSPHEFKFKLIEVSDKSGTTVPGSEEKTASLKVESGGSASAESAFVLSYLESSYLEKDDAGLPADHYYKVYEYADPEQQGTVFFDEVSYVIKVTVSKPDENKGIVASVSEVYRDGASIWTPGDSVSLGSVISFTNTLAGSLEISKTVEGTATGKGFEFEIALSEGKSGFGALPEYYDAEIRDKSGSTESVKSVRLKLVEKESSGSGQGSDNEQGANSEQGAGNDESANSKRVLKIVEASSSGAGSEGAEEYSPITLKHDQRIIIEGIPYGAEWTVTEVDADGFIVQTQVVTPNGSSEGASAGEGGEDGEASGESSSAGFASGAEESSSSTTAGAGASAASGETPAASSGESSAATVSGSIAVGSTQVNFINTQMYQLPETGGAGVVVCVIAGLALVGAALLGMRRIHRRGEAV